MPVNTQYPRQIGYMIVEDEEHTAAGILADYLRRDGYTPIFLADGAKVVSCVREQMPALILLDLMLPGASGLEICRQIRMFSSVPIIITTARIEEIDRLTGRYHRWRAITFRGGIRTR
jgi:two-component system response regulator BaeR